MFEEACTEGRGGDVGPTEYYCLVRRHLRRYPRLCLAYQHWRGSLLGFFEYLGFQPMRISHGTKKQRRMKGQGRIHGPFYDKQAAHKPPFAVSESHIEFVWSRLRNSGRPAGRSIRMLRLTKVCGDQRHLYASSTLLVVGIFTTNMHYD